MSSSYRLELNRWLDTLDVKANRVLDIGGSQEPIKGRTKSWDVKEYIIADLEQPHKDSPLPDLFLDLNTPQKHGKESILREYQSDLIFCLEVFDYVYDPVSAFRNISELMVDGGSAWVTFPSVYPLHQPVEDDALRYMPSGIVKLAQTAGLAVEQMIKRKPETNLWEQFYRAERMRSAKHHDHNFTGFIVEFSK